MAFISKDFRSPGEAWVKTEEGWERKKVLECGGGKRKRWVFVICFYCLGGTIAHHIVLPINSNTII